MRHLEEEQAEKIARAAGIIDDLELQMLDKRVDDHNVRLEVIEASKAKEIAEA